MATNERTNDVPMQGKGQYSSHSDLQHSAMLQSLSLFVKACDSLKSRSQASKNGPFSVVEYGSGHGNNSIEPLDTILQYVQSDNTQLLLSDRPENDFNTLSSTVTAWDERRSKESKTSVFVSLIPRNFYGPVVPPQSVDLAFSLSCLQHLSRAPVGADPLKLQVQASKDLSNFLDLRSTEIISGGFLIVSFVSIPTSVRSEYHGLRKSVHTAMTSMLEEKQLPQSVIAAFQVPMYNRTADDYWSVVKGSGDKWTTHEMVETEVEHPAVTVLELAKQSEGDSVQASELYADTVVDWLFAVISGYFTKALIEGLDPGHTQEDKERLLHELIRRSKDVYLTDHRDEKVYVGYIHALLERL